MKPQNEQLDVGDVTPPIHYTRLETPQTIRLIHARRSSADDNIIIQMKHFSLLHARFYSNLLCLGREQTALAKCDD